MVEKLEESVGKSPKQNKKTILLLKKAPKPKPPKINKNKKPTRKNEPKNPEKKRYKIYAQETQIFFTLSRVVSEKETELVIGLHFFCGYQSSEGML